MIGRNHRVKLLTGLAAVSVALTAIGPSYAQTAPAMGSWQPGSDAQGSSTIIGRVETPRTGQSLNPASNLLVSGWAVDTTAQGWSGVDGVEVRDSKGTKLATGTAGLARADIAEALGSGFRNSGFTAVVPGSAISNLQPGSQALSVYLHTPNKGTWFRTVSVNVLAPLAVPFPSDPVVWIAKPQDGMNITQRQINSKVSFSGVALDRNPLSSVQDSLAVLPSGIGQVLGPGCSACAGATGAIATQNRNAGINSITAFIDKPAARGDNNVFGNFGTPCSGCVQGVSILVSGKGVLNVAGKPMASIISRNYGSQYDFSGWSISMNPALLSPGPHTLFVTATSAITGKSNTSQVTFNIVAFAPKQKIQP